MSERTDFTLIDHGQVNQISAVVSGESVRVSASDLQIATGWELKPEGLCRSGICRPVVDQDALCSSDGVDLRSFAGALDLAVAIDTQESVAALDDSAEQRIDDQDNLVAADFSLPDLNGNMHSLTDFRGKKVLLIAWASW